MTEVIYVVRRGERNEELRHSLRSLSNFPHDGVTIAGFVPSWTTGVTAVPRRQWAETKHKAAKLNLIAALLATTSDEVTIFNDDFFVMQPVGELPVWHMGRMSSIYKTRRDSYPDSVYTRATGRTMRWLMIAGIEDPVSYDLHIPMTFDRRKLLDLLYLEKDPTLHWRSIYGNIHRIPATYRDDVKNAFNYEDLDFLSTDDDHWRRSPIGAYIRAKFPDPGKYEV